MSVSQVLVLIFSIGLTASCTGGAWGQIYPHKPVRIVTGGVGGGNDFILRLIAQGISIPLGQQVIVDNRAGIIPMQIVAQAPADGYTLLLHSSAIWIAPLLEKTPYDPTRDFSPITLVSTEPSVLAIHSSVASTSIKELIALAKAKPGSLNYASSVIGGSNHLAGELFKSMAVVNIVNVNYKGGGQALTALLGGEVQMGFISAPTIAPHIKSGKLKALGVTSLQPTALAPGLPAIAASVPGYEMVGMTAIFAPAGTARTAINTLNREIVKYINQSDAKEKLLNAGQEIVGSSPNELATKMKSDMDKWDKVIKDAGIKVN